MIRMNPDSRAMRIPQTPRSVWESRITDSRSRDIFFVDVARSLGIEARMDLWHGRFSIKQDGKWVDVDFDAAAQQTAKTGKLVLTFTLMASSMILSI